MGTWWVLTVGGGGGSGSGAVRGGGRAPRSRRSGPCTTMVLVQAASSNRPPAVSNFVPQRIAKLPSRTDSNVVLEPMNRVGEGLIETMRVRGGVGRLPFLDRHLARLRASMAALGRR